MHTKISQPEKQARLGRPTPLGLPFVRAQRSVRHLERVTHVRASSWLLRSPGNLAHLSQCRRRVTPRAVTTASRARHRARSIAIATRRFVDDGLVIIF